LTLTVRDGERVQWWFGAMKMALELSSIAYLNTHSVQGAASEDVFL
jgi:hypothetical protein